jgi:hypothetical protein
MDVGLQQLRGRGDGGSLLHLLLVRLVRLVGLLGKLRRRHTVANPDVPAVGDGRCRQYGRRSQLLRRWVDHEHAILQHAILLHAQSSRHRLWRLLGKLRRWKSDSLLGRRLRRLLDYEPVMQHPRLLRRKCWSSLRFELVSGGRRNILR